MKRVSMFILAFAFAMTAVQAQKLMTRTGHVWFFSHTPVEDIEAHNNQATSIIDPATGEIAFVVLMRGFQFEKALMQEHFNEKYVESDTYPKATFQGKIKNPAGVDFKKNGTYAVTVVGEMTLHGVTKTVEAPGQIKVQDGAVSATSTFPLTLAEYGIEVPNMVRNKIAEVMEIHVDTKYEPATR